jgi:hypothetical protein
MSDLERNNLPSSPAAAVGHALASFPEIVQAQYQVEDAGIGLNLAKSGRLSSNFRQLQHRNRLLRSFPFHRRDTNNGRLCAGLPWSSMTAQPTTS